MPESFLPLTLEPSFEDRKLALPTQGSEFHSMKFATQASEQQHPRVISEEVNTRPQEQDSVNFLSWLQDQNFKGSNLGCKSQDPCLLVEVL